MKILYTLLFISFSALLLAQIPNADFENGTSDSIASWQSSDDFGVLEFFEFGASNSDTTVYADSGEKFAILRSDNASVASFSATFPYSQRSSGFRGKYIYLHDDSRQRFGIEIIYWQRNDSTNTLDTLAYRKEKVSTSSPSGRMFYDWLEYDMPIYQDYFRLNGNPDSCTIKFSTDAGTYTGSNTILLIDDITFAEETVAGINKHSSIHASVFPNPCAGNAQLKVQSAKTIQSVRLVDLNGRVLLRKEGALESSFAIQLPAIQNGIYLLHISTEEGSNVEKLIIK